jgi:hypothetical protein
VAGPSRAEVGIQHSSDVAPVVRLQGPFVRFIRDTDIHFSWSCSLSERSITSPRTLPNHCPQTGDLYLHQYNNRRDTQAWVWASDHWTTVREGDPNPKVPGYVFLMKSRDEPNWVKKKTLTTYRGREKRRAVTVPPVCNSTSSV